MAVGDYLKPQRSPLSVYDEQMAQMLREQSAGIGAQQIAAEAYGGKFPVGTMTSKVLSGVLARANEKRALNRDAQGKRARSLLARITAGDLPENVSIDDKGNFFTTTKEEQRIERPSEQLQQSTYGRGLEGQMAGVPAEVIPAVTEKGIMLEGNAEDPNLLERTFFGDVKGKTIENKYDLIEEAGYDPRQYMREEKQDVLAEENQAYIKQERILDTKIKKGNIRRSIINEEADKFNLQNLKDLKSDNQETKLTALTRQRDLLVIRDKVNKKAFGGNDYVAETMYHAKLLRESGFNDESLKLMEMIKDERKGLIVSKKDQREIDKDIDKVARDYNKIEGENIEPVFEAVSNYKKLLDTVDDVSGVGGYASLVLFLKQLDGSVVKEGEVRSFNKFQGAIEEMKVWYEQQKNAGLSNTQQGIAIKRIAKKAMVSLIADYNDQKNSRINDYYNDAEYYNTKRIYAGHEDIDIEGLGIGSILLYDLTNENTIAAIESEIDTEEFKDEKK